MQRPRTTMKNYGKKRINQKLNWSKCIRMTKYENPMIFGCVFSIHKHKVSVTKMPNFSFYFLLPFECEITLLSEAIQLNMCCARWRCKKKTHTHSEVFRQTRTIDKSTTFNENPQFDLMCENQQIEYKICKWRSNTTHTHTQTPLTSKCIPNKLHNEHLLLFGDN